MKGADFEKMMQESDVALLKRKQLEACSAGQLVNVASVLQNQIIKIQAYHESEITMLAEIIAKRAK